MWRSGSEVHLDAIVFNFDVLGERKLQRSVFHLGLKIWRQRFIDDGLDFRFLRSVCRVVDFNASRYIQFGELAKFLVFGDILCVFGIGVVNRLAEILDKVFGVAV